MTELSELFKRIPHGCRASVGHTPHWHTRDSMPKLLRKRPYEAYVVNSVMIGTKGHIFVESDGATPEEALEKALEKAMQAEAKLREEK